MKNLCFALAATATFTLATGAIAGTVNANNPNGDAFSNPTAVNLGQSIGTSGWYYNNVRAGGSAGVDGTYARSGNGSLHFSGPANAKADVEFLPNGVPVAGDYYSSSSLGAFSSFMGMSYEWYRNSVSGTDARQMPALRVLIDRDGNLATTNDRGGLVFERVYNEGADQSAAPVNAWTSETIGKSTFVWNFGLNLGGTTSINDTPYAYDDTLAEWQAFMPNAIIIGFSAGIGSGWSGTFNGAVDNIAWNIGGVTTTTNFETQAVVAAVPEPETLSLLAAALVGLGLTTRRRRR